MAQSQKKHFLKLSWHKRQVVAYLKYVEFCTNNALDFVTNPLNNLDDGKRLDTGRMLKLSAALNLLVADSIALAQSNSKYVKQRIFFSILDKIANMAVWVWRPVGFNRKFAERLEAEIRNRMFAGSHSASVVRILKKTSTAYHVRLGEELTALARESFSSWRTSLIAMLPHTRMSDVEKDNAIAKLAPILRNTAHGTFSQSDRFEKLMFEIKPELISDADLFATFTLLALCADPAVFFADLVTGSEH